ncbi:diguanylate cyclase [Gracilibacillus sp. S3-1-1]|uniref:Diguanylate cyclase n=1 Tax=Gracilibacillus pellucidus TaxID=3095368 RepID=A0ACC6M6C7_9BACI|nr:diguanylate cyclase [Gracilibacillus sp. S3-1-1]MDX8046441.1 diguanylate cyclase [Gracilibacillus sp. S3-1-1]
MKTFFNKEKTILFLVFLHFFVSFVMFYFLLQSDDLGVVLIFLYSLIVTIALFRGVIEGLITSLIILFTVGTALLVIMFRYEEFDRLYQTVITPEYLVIFGGGLIIGSLLSGFIHRYHTEMIRENSRLKGEIDNFVSIDPDTSFDNAGRMEIEIKREMTRINRHGGLFTLMFLELDYYEEFVKAYGHQELNHLLEVVGEKVEQSLRYSDRKFRYSDNKFAFLLIETSKTNVEIVADKLGEQLAEHQLLNGKKVTLFFHISFDEYNESKKDIHYTDLIGDLQKETVFYDL